MARWHRGRFKAHDGSSIEEVTVKCPVSASKNAGGLIGDIEVDGRFSIQKILLASVVNAEENGGGFLVALSLKTHQVTSCSVTVEVT